MDYERRERILAIIKKQGYASVEELCGKLFVSSATMRRELRELEEARQIRRARGGAYSVESNSFEDPYAIREKQNIEAKRIIAAKAMLLLRDGMTVFLDSSSTVYIMSEIIDGFNDLHVITNSLKTALLLAARRGITICCACGRPRAGTVSLVGQSTVNYLRSFNADAAFVSACGFDEEAGTSEANEEESYVKRSMIEHSRERYLLIDTSKQGKIFMCKTANMRDFSKVITEDRTVNAQFNAAGAGGQNTRKPE